jgi:hypothetical protein
MNYDTQRRGRSKPEGKAFVEGGVADTDNEEASEGLKGATWEPTLISKP